MPFIDPLRDNDRSQVEALRSMHFAEEQLPLWAEHLNQRHGVAYSNDFWRIVITPWLLELTQRIWRSFVTLEAVIAATAGRPMRAEVWTAPVEWDFATAKEFMSRVVQDDFFSWWIDSLVLKAMAPSHWTLVEKTVTPPSNPVGAIPKTSPSLKQRAIRWVKYQVGYSDVLGAGVWGLLIAMLANLGRPRIRGQGLKPMLPPAEPLPEAFRQVFASVARLTMPRAYGADFAELCRAAQRVPYRAGRLRIGTIDAWNEREKIISAHAAEAGETLVQIQHGGTYGTHRARRRTCITEYTYGPFITWGWTKHCDYSGRFIPLPSPKLSRMADSYDARRNDGSLILVGERVRWRETRLVQQPSSSGWTQYLADVLDFLGQLPPSVSDHVRIRPYREIWDCDTDLGKFIDARYRPLPRVNGNLEVALRTCKLAVMTPGTTLHMSMAANIPTLAFWTEGQFPMSPGAVPLFQALKECGVYCTTPADAAAQIARVWDDVDGWWQSEPVQRARKAWVEQFAHTDPAWFRRWVVTMRKL